MFDATTRAPPRVTRARRVATGPTGAAHPAHPSIRPSSVVRTQRRFGSRISAVFQRGPWALSRERGTESREAYAELVLGLQVIDFALVREKHVLAVQQVRVVQPDVGERCQPVGAAAATGRRRGQ